MAFSTFAGTSIASGVSKKADRLIAVISKSVDFQTDKPSAAVGGTATINTTARAAYHILGGIKDTASLVGELTGGDAFTTGFGGEKNENYNFSLKQTCMQLPNDAIDELNTSEVTILLFDAADFEAMSGYTNASLTCAAIPGSGTAVATAILIVDHCGCKISQKNENGKVAVSEVEVSRKMLPSLTDSVWQNAEITFSAT